MPCSLEDLLLWECLQWRQQTESIKRSPEPREIKERRKEARLFQRQAADLVGVHERTWRHWEGGTWEMPYALWELFLIKTDNIGGIQNGAA